MLRKVWWIAPVLAAFVGCGGDGSAATTTGTPTAIETTDAPKVVAVILTDDEVELIKTLPEDEQTIALAQKVCPVGFDPAKPDKGGHLGSMGKPFKKVVNGKIVFLCCKGCRKKFDSDPETYLAKAEAFRTRSAEESK